MPNKRAQVEARRAKVADLYCKGVYQAKIAVAVGVTQQQVSLDLKAVREVWKRTMAEAFDRLRSEQLAKIDAIEAEAWRGWRRSLKDATKKLAKVRSGDSGVMQETRQTEEGQAGDPRFLVIVDSCIDRRCKLIGAYAPNKIAGEGPGGAIVVKVLGPGMSMSDLV